MSNHYHLLLSTPEGNLSQIMRHINGGYSTWFNKRHNRYGHLFQGRYNPGKLFGDLTIEKLKGNEYQSRTRNKLIAEAFYLTRDIEKYGSGFIRVRTEIKSYPTMEFVYEESGDGFLAALKYRQQKISSASVSLEGINEGINLLLENIRNKPGSRIPQLANSLGIPAKTIERWVTELKRQNRIEYRGSKKTGGYYAINSQG